MTEESSFSPMEIEFQEKRRKAWDTVRVFMEAASTAEICFGPDNPQHQLAREFFDIYLENRPSKIATQALLTAFTMWGNLVGVSGQVRTALQQISVEEDVWDQVLDGITSAFNRDQATEEGFGILEELVRKVMPLKSRSALLYAVSRHQKEQGHSQKARVGFEQIIAWDASDWHVQHASGDIYEITALNAGQPAPAICGLDIDGNLIDLSNNPGKVVVLHFWGTSCSWCRIDYPSIRRIAQTFSPEDVAVVGASDDNDFELLRAKIKEEDLFWPQICEGNGSKDRLFTLYNVTALPTVYILDQNGCIAHKIVGGRKGEEIERAVQSLVGL
ncbi:MAG: Thiol-disulfide oxidoreductase ResA [Nitrosomonadaceae bacterium]|nr:Thiol-disulfide oxidoreductase ResA [Nitrosomonadaceae bacterium]